MIIPKRNQFLKEISKESRENFFNGFDCFGSSFLGIIRSSDGYTIIFLLIFVLFIFVLVYYGIIAPYVAFILAFFSKNVLIILNALHNIIWHTISLLGFMGKVQCCCLYRPDNWLFLMLFSDFMCFIISLITGFATLSISIKFENGWLVAHGFYNAFYSFLFVGFHIHYYNELNKIYKEIRDFEVNVIKNCVIKYIDIMEENYLSKNK